MPSRRSCAPTARPTRWRGHGDNARGSYRGDARFPGRAIASSLVHPSPPASLWRSRCVCNDGEVPRMVDDVPALHTLPASAADCGIRRRRTSAGTRLDRRQSVSGVGSRLASCEGGTSKGPFHVEPAGARERCVRSWHVLNGAGRVSANAALPPGAPRGTAGAWRDSAEQGRLASVCWARPRRVYPRGGVSGGQRRSFC